MCGIAGFVTSNSHFDEQTIRRMTDSIIHRGPDADGVFFDGNCGLGHRRLSIVDLTASANQPMTSDCGRYVMVYNGEVYNYKELNGKLEKEPNRQNKKLKTRSDTEVILELFSQYGESFIHDLNGMFAIAIYDKEERALHLFRDRTGIKPLFYYRDENIFLFASEIKAILNVLPEKPKINIDSICNYLHLGFIPAPETIYKNIYKVNPATHLIIRENKIQASTYWSIADQLSKPRITALSESKHHLNNLITDSVSLQLNSDVTNGVFLSSGIDSSLITAKAVQVSSEKIKTFTLGFKDEQSDESKFAKTIAQKLGTEHHEIIIEQQDAIDCLNDALHLYEEPNSDASIIPTLILSKFAKKTISVALSGEGADELFFGYGRYKWAKRLDSGLSRLIGQTASYACRFMSSRYQRIGKLLDTRQSKNLVTHIFSQENYNFTETELKTLVKPEFQRPTISIQLNEDPIFSSSSNQKQKLDTKQFELSLAEQQSIFDQLYYLPDNLLLKIDRATMHNSLEARVPFLDHRIIEFALSLDQDLKIKDHTSKYLLKEILFEHLPPELYDRPKKGFSIPLKKWLKNDMSYLINEYLSTKSIEETGIFNSIAVDQLIHEYGIGKDYLAPRIWLIIVLQHWLTKNKSTYRN